MHFYQMTQDCGLSNSLKTLRIFSDATDKRAFDMTDITYRFFPTSKDIEIIETRTKRGVRADAWDDEHHYWDSITAREAQPIVTAWTQQGITLITAISKQKLGESKAARLAA